MTVMNMHNLWPIEQGAKYIQCDIFALFLCQPCRFLCQVRSYAMFINSIKAVDYKTLGSNFARLSLKQLVFIQQLKRSLHEILTNLWFGLMFPPFQSL